MDWTDLEKRLANTIGLESSALGTTVFRQSVGRRMRACQVESLTVYMQHLDSDCMEFQALVEELVVRESWFFRHTHAFELLRRHAASTMLQRQKPYRVLSFPCAGGEEPYSIVMSLREAGLDFHQFQVDAADISETAIQTARAGKYGLRSVRVVAPEVLSGYFRVADQSVEVLPEIRQAVRFILANIITTQSMRKDEVYDAVFCRNLLIYLTPAARKRVIDNVAQWLLPNSLFFVGHAEMLKEHDELFEPVRERGAFAYCRRSQTTVIHPGTLSVIPVVGAVPTKSVGKVPSGRHAPATAPLDLQTSPVVLQLELDNRPYAASQEALREQLARKVSELSGAASYSEAIEVCEQQLRQHGPSPQVYHLLGMIYQAAESYEQAARALERAVYLDPGHEEALLALALLARRRGDVQIADRFEHRSRRAHDRRQPT